MSYSVVSIPEKKEVVLTTPDCDFKEQEVSTEERNKLAVRQNGLALASIPEKERTEELYKLAVCQNGLALEFVRGIKSHALCLMAVKQNAEALEFVPVFCRSWELCKEAYRQKRGLHFIPDDYRKSFGY